MVQLSEPIEPTPTLKSDPLVPLSVEHQAIYDAVERHFKAEEFQVKSAESPSALVEEEKFWLVRIVFLFKFLAPNPYHHSPIGDQGMSLEVPPSLEMVPGNDHQAP